MLVHVAEDTSYIFLLSRAGLARTAVSLQEKLACFQPLVLLPQHLNSTPNHLLLLISKIESLLSWDQKFAKFLSVDLVKLHDI